MKKKTKFYQAFNVAKIVLLFHKNSLHRSDFSFDSIFLFQNKEKKGPALVKCQNENDANFLAMIRTG